MLTRYRFAETGYAPAQGQEADFFDLQLPDPAERAALALELGIPQRFLSDPLDPRERPRVEQEGDCTLVIIRVPLPGAEELLRPLGREGPQAHPPSTAPLGMVLARGRLVTVSAQPGLVQDLLGRAARKPRPSGAIPSAFKILLESAGDFILQLELMEELTDRAEASLSRAQHNEEIMTLLSVDKALIHYTVALKSNRNIMERLMDPHVLTLAPEETDALERALTENQQAIYMADIFGQILGSMSDAFGTVISNNLNKVVKFLTGITIVLMLPTFIVGAYGMNVRLPFAESRHAFWILFLLCLLSCSLLWLYFSRKKWV